ncbi:unnamed protein product, partial [Protopolystoma xenopodis]
PQGLLDSESLPGVGPHRLHSTPDCLPERSASAIIDVEVDASAGDTSSICLDLPFSLTPGRLLDVSGNSQGYAVSPGFPRRSTRAPITELINTVRQMTDIRELRSLAQFLIDQYHVISTELFSSGLEISLLDYTNNYRFLSAFIELRA